MPLMRFSNFGQQLGMPLIDLLNPVGHYANVGTLHKVVVVDLNLVVWRMTLQTERQF